MIKKIFYSLLVVFTCFIGLNKVSASSDFSNPYVRVNGNNFFNNTITINSSYDFRFDVGVFYNGSTTQTTNDRIYGRLALCTSSDIYSPYSHTDYVNTNISCDGGFVSFIYFDLVYESSGNFTTYFMLAPLNTSSADVKFFGLSFSYTPFDRYNSDDTLIKQNDVILSDLQSLYYTTSEGFTEVTYKLNDTIKELQDLKSLLSQLFNSCRDSYNLLSSSFVQKTSNSLTSDINNLKSGSYTFSFDGNLTPTWQLSIYKISDGNRTSLKYNYNNYNITFYLDEVSDIQIEIYRTGILLSDISKTMLNSGTTSLPYEEFGNKVCKSKVDETNDAINQSNKKLDETNNKLQQQQDFMNDDDTSGSSSEAESFFEGFSTNTYGLTSIITAPLELIGNIAGSTCSPLQVPLPFVGTNLSLPCMSTIYKQYFGNFLTIYQTITFGIVAYWVCIRIFALVKDFKNPEHDEIEVMDL